MNCLDLHLCSESLVHDAVLCFSVRGVSSLRAGIHRKFLTESTFFLCPLAFLQGLFKNVEMVGNNHQSPGRVPTVGLLSQLPGETGF